MCTSIVINRKKTLVGWNLDILNIENRVHITEDGKGVFIEVKDNVEGWMPLFGANSRGEFVGMPTCWPFDERSNFNGDGNNVIMLDIDLLLQRKTFEEIRLLVEKAPVFSIPGLTFMSALSDKNGNVLYIVPGQGFKYLKKPSYSILTNFSPFKGASEKHPWMGLDRYEKAEELLKAATEDFDVNDCFSVLKAVSQTVCPTKISMVYDVTERIVYWCENRKWERVDSYAFGSKTRII